MTTRIQVQSTQAVVNLRANLIAYCGDTLDDLACARQELDSFWRWLGQLLVQTQRQIDRLEDEIAYLEYELAGCEDYCDDIERAFDIARDKLTQKIDYRNRIEQHQEAIKAAGQAFLKEASRLDAFLNEDLEHGLGFLRMFVDYLERYAAVSTAASESARLVAASSAAAAYPGSSPTALGSYNQAELHAKLLNEGNQFLDGGRSDQGVAGFRNYKTHFYGAINAFMRRGEVNPPNVTPYPINSPDPAGAMAAITASMAAEFGQFSLDRRATMLRGVYRLGDAIAAFDSKQPGDVIQDNGFISTTLDPNIANDRARYDGYILRIHCVPGVSYLPLSEPGDNDPEAELVLPPGTAMFVTGRSIGSIIGADGGKQTIFDAIPIPPGVTAPASWQDVEQFAAVAWKKYADDHQ